MNGAQKPPTTRRRSLGLGACVPDLGIKRLKVPGFRWELPALVRVESFLVNVFGLRLLWQLLRAERCIKFRGLNSQQKRN